MPTPNRCAWREQRTPTAGRGFDPTSGGVDWVPASGFAADFSVETRPAIDRKGRFVMLPYYIGLAGFVATCLAFLLVLALCAAAGIADRIDDR